MINVEPRPGSLSTVMSPPHHLTESSADHEAKSGTDWKIGWLRPPGLPPIRTLDDIQGRARSLLGQEHNPAEGGDKN
jgi:hypothetical protein